MRSTVAREVPRWPPEAWVPLLAGLLWLWRAPDHGFAGFLVATVPGCLLLGSGVSMLLMPGDRRISQFAAVGGVLGALLALPAFVVTGFGTGVLLFLASAAAFLAAGWHAVVLEPFVEGVPEPELGLAMAAQVAVDEALLAQMVFSIRLPTRDDHGRVEREVAEARQLFEQRGWLEKPVLYHVDPPVLDQAELRPARMRKIDYEQLRFESGYEPHDGEPGGERWLSYTRNRTAHAWVLRHAGEDRPWLVCIHGYVMGAPWIDLAAFPPEYFHRRLGLNMLVPTLPLHGRRAIGRRSGEGYFQADVLDTVHAEAQAMWDLRRCLGWIRAQSRAPIGVLGLSLGGYNAALLAGLDADLACVIAGIPPVDFTRIVYRHAPPLTQRTAAEMGLMEAGMREVKRVISPLDLEPRVPHERRYLFGGVGDRIVPPDQVRDLWRHWQEPRIAWYQGAHVTFRAHAAVRDLMNDALRDHLGV